MKQQQHKNMFVYFIRDESVCVERREPSEMPHVESKKIGHTKLRTRRDRNGRNGKKIATRRRWSTITAAAITTTSSLIRTK